MTTQGAVVSRVGADAGALARLIRFLTPLGVFASSGGKVYITELGRTLADGPANSMRAVARYLMQTHYAPFTKLVHTVRTGEVAATEYLGVPFFDWINASSERAELQNAAMASFTAGGRGDLLDRLDLPGGRAIADIGGADGSVLAEILTRLPGRSGIVFDMPGMVTAAPAVLAAARLSGRTTVIAGSFFDGVPAADVYVLSAVLHDWDDTSAARILRNIAGVAAPDARLILIELVVPEDGAPHATKVIDFTMMAMLGGKERTESQWRRLLEDGGFTLDRVIAGSGMYVAIEATPHRS